MTDRAKARPPAGRPLRTALARAASLALLAAGLLGCGLTATSAWATDFTWAGTAALPSGTGDLSDWSQPANWSSDLAPSDTVGTIDFPVLTSDACTTSPPTGTCYASDDDVEGLAAGAITIDDGAGYAIDGYQLTLGGGGLVAAPSAGDPALTQPASYLNLPLTRILQ